MGKNPFSNDDAVRVLFELYAQRVFQAAYYVLRDRAAAEDIVQDTFLAAMKSLDRLDNPERVEAWLVRIAINKACTEYGKRRKLVTLDGRCGDDFVDPDGIVDLLNRLEMEQAIESLPEDYQVVLFLKYYRDLTTRQMAAFLDIPEGTVKSRLRKARDLVLRFLNAKAGTTE